MEKTSKTILPEEERIHIWKLLDWHGAGSILAQPLKICMEALTSAEQEKDNAINSAIKIMRRDSNEIAALKKENEELKKKYEPNPDIIPKGTIISYHTDRSGYSVKARRLLTDTLKKDLPRMYPDDNESCLYWLTDEEALRFYEREKNGYHDIPAERIIKLLKKEGKL